MDNNPNRSRRLRRWRLIVLLWGSLASATAYPALDLRNASVERLDNGLTVILLEDRNFPVASVQMLYRVGARNEITGQTGLAHFLEHMAFRASENFPDTGLVSAIYARGGEWHGYTWTDQTTYFATVPKEHLDLLLLIEADRMGRLELSARDLEAERGSVLAEMHMYENAPKSMLIDAVMFTSFLAHPYRNNTIGWESDIENLRHPHVVAFYQRYYHPANAVLAVVGDIERERVGKRVRELFAGFQNKTPTPPPHTLEPLQTGERRVRIGGHDDRRRFMIGYRAPSANHPDYAAFLVLEALLGASSGVNFLHNDWGTPVDRGSLLDGAARDVTTWYPPSAQDYLFIVGGSAAANVTEAEVEQEIERRIDSARRRPPNRAALTAAIDEVLDELVYDLETTEDAAHQLAFFAGLEALEVLLDLPRRVATVTDGDVHRVAARYLLPERRTIAWHAPLERAGEPGIEAATAVPSPNSPEPPRAAVDATPLPPPVIAKLGRGITAMVQQSDLSPSIHVRIVFPGRSSDPSATVDEPLLGYSSLTFRARPGKLAGALRQARAALSEGSPAARLGQAPSADPETRLEQVFSEFMTVQAEPSGPSFSPALIVVSGDVGVDGALGLLEEHFGRLQAPSGPAPAVATFTRGERTVSLGRPLAQARLGYIVPAPAPRAEGFEAHRLLTYILSHDYEGRLGKEAISNRGLAYYIGSRYRCDGVNGWITLSAGVDPEKIGPLKVLMTDALAGLARQPPTADEIAEAKAHLIGRARSAAQSNRELTGALAREWLWYGEIRSAAALEARLARVSHADVLEIVPRFVSGTTIIVRE